MGKIQKFEDFMNEKLDITDKDWTIIKKGTSLPDDFVKNGVLNREKYVIEHGFSDTNKWFDEFSSPVTAEIIGSIIIGSNAYNDFRYRLRTDNDDKWDLKKTTIAKIMGNSSKSKNDDNSKIAFDDEIEYELKRYLENTIWSKVGQIEKRTKELINLHRKFIDLVKNKISANEIARKLYEYEKNILNRK